MNGRAATTHGLHTVVIYTALLTGAAIGGMELLSRSVLDIPAITVLIAVIAYVAYLGGLRAGLISAAIVSFYGVYFFSTPGQLFAYTPENALRLALLPFTSVVVAVFIGTLRNNVRASQAQIQRQLDFSKAIDTSLGEGVYALDHEGRVTFVNPAAEQVLGWTEAELRGKIMHDVIHFRRPDGTPFPREECTGLGEVLRSRKRFRTEDDMFIRKDGTMFPVAYSSSPIIDNGETIGAVIAFRDMTERKRAENALRQSEAKLRVMNAQIPAHLWITDTALHVTSVSGSALTQIGVDPERFIGKTLYDFLGVENRQNPAIVAHLRALQGESAEYDRSSVGRAFACRVEPLRDEQGRIAGCLGIALDITERKRNEQRLVTQYNVSRVLVEARSLDEAAPRILAAIGESVIWEYGALWTVESPKQVLRCVATWHAPSPELEAFITASRQTRFAPGEGLPGSVWSRREPVWIADTAREPSFPRLKLASAAGLRAGFGLPIHVDGQVTGVIEFLSRQPQQPDEALLDMVRAIGAQIGQFIERKRAEEALRSSEANLAAAQRIAHVGSWERDLLTGELHWSDEVYRILGFEPGAFEPTLDRIFAVIHPEDRAKVQQAVADAIYEDKHYSLDRRIIRPNGEERIIHGEAEVIRDEAGNPVRMLGTVHDITERTRTEQELQVRVRQQAAVATLGQHAIATPDLPTLMHEASALVAKTLRVEYCKILQLLPDGSTFLMLAGVGWKPGVVGHATVDAGSDSHAGYSLLSRDPVIVEDLTTETRFRNLPLLEEHGVVSTINVVIHGREQPFGVLEADATRPRTFTSDDIHFLQAVANVLAAAIERKAFEEQLAQERAEAAHLAELDRLRRDFIASVSHELRTPLTATRGGLGMLEISLRERLRPDEQQLLDNARRNIERQRLLIDDLLIYHQLEAGTLRLDWAPLDLRAVVGDALPTTYALTQNKGQTLELDLPHAVPTVGDEQRLALVMINLLANASVHTPTGTHIVVSGRRVDHEVQLAVSDNGPGIRAEDREAIFQHVHRLGSTEGGSGLGLAIAKGIVELHGGRIWVESAPGAGASFHIALPASIKREEHADA